MGGYRKGSSTKNQGSNVRRKKDQTAGVVVGMDMIQNTDSQYTPATERKKYEYIQEKLDRATEDLRGMVNRRAQMAGIRCYVDILERTIISLRKVIVDFVEKYEGGEQVKSKEAGI